ncbi:PD-(D/E)XK nuclease family protein [Marinococcus luteus]|uniref:PD-(D/E)XK nuclease family protein n=1 Tax=Marinococcus luteus TaxID=1122204 RepID=UPI002ACD137F|nr:PD-(D/E)XK nuclease family protein [Marinococcus luteus]MDZ5781900.1 PD-(D/E)XK nuclease family protein [Marinococcus luteus]
MNIFQALSMGNGKLNEENMSAMLGYLLSPNEPHGLGDVFLQSFLEALNETEALNDRFANVLEQDYLSGTEVIFESPYQLDERKLFIDLDLRFYSSHPSSGSQAEVVETHRVLIENKIRPQAATKDQLRREFFAVREDFEEQHETAVTMIYLTPEASHGPLQEAYEALREEDITPHRKAWFTWTGNDGFSIVSLIRLMLEKEARGEIEPISEYVRHTLKAFIRHIMDSQKALIKTPNSTADPGSLRQEVTVTSAGTRYQIQQFQSGMIIVYNADLQEKEIAKPVLRQINQEYDLGVELYSPSGKKKKTPQLGRDVLKALNAASD